VSFRGTYKYHGAVRGPGQADARYFSDAFGNMTEPYAGLYISSIGVADEVFQPWGESRVRRDYSCLIESESEYVRLRLVPPLGCSFDFIRVRLELLPVGTPSVKAKLERVPQTSSLRRAAENEHASDAYIPPAAPISVSVEKTETHSGCYRPAGGEQC